MSNKLPPARRLFRKNLVLTERRENLGPLFGKGCSESVSITEQLL